MMGGMAPGSGMMGIGGGGPGPAGMMGVGGGIGAPGTGSGFGAPGMGAMGPDMAKPKPGTSKAKVAATDQPADPLGQAESALKRLRTHPDDPQAAEALERALRHVQQLKEKTHPGGGNPFEPREETSKKR